jgi:hypothetical protein
MTDEVSLHDLEGLPRHDPRVRHRIHAIYPQLRAEILNARASARREELSITAIRERFTILSEANESDISEIILKNPGATTAERAAKDIICNHVDRSFSTVDRYT